MPPPDPHADYVTIRQLSEKTGLAPAELNQLRKARLLLPDTADGRFRPKMVSWGKKLRYLLHRGWEIDEIKAWSAGRWKLRNPRQWPPKPKMWRAP